MLVAFPIAAYIFRQTDRLASVKVALAEQARDNERQRLLIQELNRVKNLLTTVMSICTQTARGASDVELFAEAFNRRLVALAAAHDVLSRDVQDDVSFSELSAQVLAPYGERIKAHGPHVSLRPAAAVPMSLILHELATNAAKHGSLSGGGSVEVAWVVNGAFHLEWIESGGPAVRGTPIRTGFGSRLIRHVVEHELGGSLNIEYRTEGLLLGMRIPAGRID